MKKILYLALSLILLLSCSAVAEEEREITFQGVPWGSSISDTYQMLLDNGLIDAEYDKHNGEHVKTLGNAWGLSLGAVLGMEDDVYLTSDNGVGIAATRTYRPVIARFSDIDPESDVYFLINDMKIGGYKVGNFYSYYAYSENNTELLSVVISLKVDNAEEAYSDLTAKLTTVYGECSQFKASVAGFSLYNGKVCNAWQGANNTAVVLSSSYGITDILSGGVTYYIDLIYGTLDAQKILDAYYAEYQANTPTPAPVDSTDTSGL